MTEHRSRLALAALIVASATIVSRIAGLGRESVTAAVYGTNADYNLLLSVSTIPSLVQQLVADAAIGAAFVPVLAMLFAEGQRERAFRLAANLSGLIVVAVGILVVIMLVLAGPLTSGLFPRLTSTPESAHLATSLTRILLPTVLFLSLTGALSGLLNALERFTVPAIISIAWNLAIIVAIVVLHGRLGVYAAAVGILAGTIIQWAMVAVEARRAGGSPWPRFALRDPLLRKVLLLMVPITITLGVLSFNALIGTWFAQFANDRSGAAVIGFAFRLYQVPQGIFAVTIGTVLFPSLSRFALTREDGRFGETISFGIRQMIVASLPFIAWFMVMPEAFVRITYQRGEFDAVATAEVSRALAFMALGLVFANSNIMLNRAFQSMQRAWLPFYASLGNLVATVALCWLLHKSLGIAGITLTFGLVSLINFTVLAVLLRRQLGSLDGRRIVRTAWRALVCAVVLGAVSGAVWRLLTGFAAGGLVQLIVAAGVAVLAGGLAYVVLARLLALDELTAVWRALVRRRPGARRA